MLVLSGLVVPITRGDAWDEVLRRTAHTFRGIALAHPHVVPLLVTRPLAPRSPCVPWAPGHRRGDRSTRPG
jgi:hypothetical protein